MTLLCYIMESTVVSYEKTNTMCIYACMYVTVVHYC